MKKIIFLLLALISVGLVYASYYLYNNNYSSYKEYNYQNKINKTIYYKLYFVSNYSFDMFEDKHMVWKKSLQRDVDVDYIVTILDYTHNDLDNEYCLEINKKTDADKAMLCLDTYYNERGYHELIKAEIDEIYALIPKATNSVLRQRAQSAVYLLEDLNKIKMSSEKDIEKVYNLYKDYKNEIENEIADVKKKI